MAYKIQIEYRTCGHRVHEMIRAHLTVVEHDHDLSSYVLGSVCNGYSDKVVLGAFFTRDDAQSAVAEVLEKAKVKIDVLRTMLRIIPDIETVTL